MDSIVENVLYTDTQAARPAGYCPRCGGALYRPGLLCIRCRRDEP